MNDLYEALLPHVGHDLTAAALGMDTTVAAFTEPTHVELQCRTCASVILDSNQVDLESA